MTRNPSARINKSGVGRRDARMIDESPSRRPVLRRCSRTAFLVNTFCRSTGRNVLQPESLERRQLAAIERSGQGDAAGISDLGAGAAGVGGSLPAFFRA